MPRVVVIGAGAAGTMAAIFAASDGVETLLLERTHDGGRKILISGGGRCNILPARVDESRFVTDSSPHLLRRMLRSWPLHEQIAFFEARAGLPLVEETESGKLFPKSQRARDVRDKLIAYARRQRRKYFQQCARDSDVGHPATGGSSSVMDGAPIEGDAVVLATGGLSVPHTGSDGRGLLMAETLGHAMNTTYAALTPLTVEEGFSHRSRACRPFTSRHHHRAFRHARGSRDRRISVHASGLQRPRDPRRLARRGAIARGGRPDRRASRSSGRRCSDSRLGSGAAPAWNPHRARRRQRRTPPPSG